jgi:hypothetical protein
MSLSRGLSTGSPDGGHLNVRRSGPALLTPAHRNAVNKKVMASMPSTPQKMPFEMKHMAFGGFRTLVEARRG